jgi:hypothetical protein
MVRTLKSYIRNSPVYGPFLRYRASRFESVYRRRRDTYHNQLIASGNRYHEADIKQSIRDRIQARGYEPVKRRPGQIRTLAVIGEYSWHPTLIRTLRSLGPVTNCDPGEFGIKPPYADQLHRNRPRLNARILEILSSQPKNEPFDWLFVYGGGFLLTPKTLGIIHSDFGIPSATMWLDDKNSWTGPVIDGVDMNQPDIAAAYDVAWTSATVACEWYLAEGGRPIYLPEGCDPDEYYPRTNNYEHSVSFMGACYGCRPVVIRHLRKHGVPIQVFGSGWRGSSRYAGSPSQLFSESQINFGIGGIAFSESLTNVKGRDFDVPCTGGGVYLTAYNPDLAKSFHVGKEILCYRNLDEAIEMIREYSANPDACRAIAQAGRQRSLAEHTWQHRYLTICEILGITADDEKGG